MPAPITDVDLMKTDANAAVMVKLLTDFIIKHNLSCADAVCSVMQAAGDIVARAIIAQHITGYVSPQHMEDMVNHPVMAFKLAIAEALVNGPVNVGNGAEQ